MYNQELVEMHSNLILIYMVLIGLRPALIFIHLSLTKEGDIVY